MASKNTNNLLRELQHLNAPQLRRLLVEHLTKQKLGLYWESNAIERDAALNANVVLPRLVPEFSHTPEGTSHHRNLIIEGDNFDSLRLLRATHAGKVAPLGSWIAGMNEAVSALEESEDDEPEVLRSARGGVATDEVKNVLGSKAFPYRSTS